MKTRRVEAPAGQWIAAARGVNYKTPYLDPWQGQRCGVLAILMGRDWFPGGPYNHPRRGSTPLRSTICLYISILMGELQ
jgi:hypothetical protein